MKRKLLLICIYAFTFNLKVNAQSSVSSTWSLVTDGSAAKTGAGAADITVLPQVLGAGISSVSYGNSYDVDNTPTNDNWQKMGVKSAESSYNSAVTSNFYTEYKLTPIAGKYYQLNTVSISVVGTGGSTNRLVALYSLDGFTTSATLANPTATYNYNASAVPPTVSPYAATEADPVQLINVGNTTTADLEGREVLTFSNLQINVNPSQTLSVRFFYFQTGTGNRFVANKNITFSGKSDSAPIPLPLDFLSVKVSLLNDISAHTKLEWATTNEVNTQKFEIERSQNIDFKSIGEVMSKNTAGVHLYSFIDNAPLENVNYYRLKQIDNDGVFKYSDIVYINNRERFSLTVYPNPVIESINVIHPIANKNAYIHLYSLSGLKVNTIKVKEGTNTSTVDVSKLTSGNFLMVFENEGVKLISNLIKQ